MVLKLSVNIILAYEFYRLEKLNDINWPLLSPCCTKLHETHTVLDGQGHESAHPESTTSRPSMGGIH